MRAPPGLPLVAALVLAEGALLATLWSRREAPPVEVHSWRQALAANVARSYRCGQPFGWPRTDACAAAPGGGVTAMELPFYAWTMARLAPALGPHGGERGVAFASALALPAVLLLLARRLLGRLPPPARDAGAVAATLAPLTSPLFLAYGGSLLPEVPALALALGGAVAVLAGAERERRLLLSAGALTLSAGVATKLSTGPVLALTAAALLARAVWAPREERVRRWMDLALHAALGLSLPALWYLGWNPRLVAAEARHLFWLPPPSLLGGVGGLIPQAFFGAGELFGGAGAAVAGVATAIGLSGARGARLPIAACGLSAAAVLSLLGWHARVHEYDALALLPALALAGGAGVAVVVAALPRPRRALAAVLAPAIAVAPGYPLALGGLAERERAEAEGVLLLGHDLDLVLPPDQPLLTPGQGDDPRVAYFAARPTWNDPPLSCSAPAPLACAVTLWGAPGPCGREATSVMFPDATLTCGLDGGGLAAVRARLRTSLHGTPHAVTGMGRFLGWDGAHRRGGPAEVLLFFEAEGGPVRGEKLRTDLPVRWPPAAPPAGAIYAVRLTLPAAGRFEAWLDGERIAGTTQDAGEVENRCVPVPGLTANGIPTATSSSNPTSTAIPP